LVRLNIGIDSMVSKVGTFLSKVRETLTSSFRKAWEAAHVRSTMNTTEGTAQPEWLDRFRKVRTPNQYKPLAPQSRGTDSKLVADVPGFEPGFSA
jgi:hypothetical protein